MRIRIYLIALALSVWPAVSVSAHAAPGWHWTALLVALAGFTMLASIPLRLLKET